MQALTLTMNRIESQLELSDEEEGAVERVKEVAKAWKQTHRIAPGNYTGGSTEEYPTST